MLIRASMGLGGLMSQTMFGRYWSMTMAPTQYRPSYDNCPTLMVRLPDLHEEKQQEHQ